MSIFKEHKTIADRSSSDRRRHREKIDRAIREGIHNIVAEESIIGKDGKKKIKIPNDISILGGKAGEYDVHRLIYWHFLKCFWDESNNFERSVGVNFDWYSPKYAYRHTPSEVKKWFKDTQIRISTFKEIESGISVTGVKK